MLANIVISGGAGSQVHPFVLRWVPLQVFWASRVMCWSPFTEHFLEWVSSKTSNLMCWCAWVAVLVLSWSGRIASFSITTKVRSWTDVRSMLGSIWEPLLHFMTICFASTLHCICSPAVMEPHRKITYKPNGNHKNTHKSGVPTVVCWQAPMFSIVDPMTVSLESKLHRYFWNWPGAVRELLLKRMRSTKVIQSRQCLP